MKLHFLTERCGTVTTLAGPLALACLLTMGAPALGDTAGDRRESLSTWRFAEAMDHHRPIARVPGSASTPLCSAAPSEDPRYADAIALAEAMGSYSLLIWHGGRCEFARYFENFTSELRPDTASMHKTVVALLLAAAIADGYIGSADDTLGNYLPAWRDDPRGEISLRAVLHMASGLAPLSREGGLDSPAWTYVVGPGDARAVTLGRPLRTEPGTRFHYSGFNTQLLLMVIESATGQRYRDYLSERLWQPLGAADAYLWLYDEPAPMARAYSALMARAEDWLRVGLLISNFGRVAGLQLIPSALIEEMTTPGPAYANYGWQLWLGNEYEPVRYYNREREGMNFSAAEPFAVDDMIYLDGIGGQRVYISRSENLVIVRQGDSRFDWDDTRLPNLIIRALRGS